MGRILGEVHSNQQFDDSLENVEQNKENSSSTNTTFTKENAKSIFYEIPNTPVSVKKRRLPIIREEIRKSLSNTVTLRKAFEKQQEQVHQTLLKKSKANVTTNLDNNNAAYIKEDKKPKNKVKICDVRYLKTIDNLLNAINTELEFGRINSNFQDDHKYIEIFNENVNKLTSHLHAKLKFNAGLKLKKAIIGWHKCKEAKQTLNQLRKERNAAIKIQSQWRRYQAMKKYSKSIHDNLARRLNAAVIIQRNYRLYLVQKQKSFDELQKKRNRCASIIQRSWRRYKFISALNSMIELRKADDEFRNFCASFIQRNWRRYRLISVLNDRIRARKIESIRNQSACLIQRCWRNYQLRKFLQQLAREQMQQELENHSATIIQRNWKVYLLKKRMHSLIEQHRNEIYLIVNVSASLIQRNWRNYRFRSNINRLVQHTRNRRLIKEQQQRLENRAASIIQKNWRIRQFEKHLNSRLIEKQRLKTEIMMKRLALENRSALVIQSNWRVYQAKKLLAQLKHNKQSNAASIIKRSWQSYVFRRNLTNRMKLNQIRRVNKAALIIQHAWRSYLNRTQRAAILIQKSWRGFATRLHQKRENKDNEDVSGLFKRISEVNKNAIYQPTVGEKTKIALQKLLNYKYHGTALNMLVGLERTTNLSDESCIQMANVMVIEVLLKVVRECNRSEPCLQIIKLVFSVILNIAKNEKALPVLCAIPSLKENIIDTLNKHYKKTGIFLKAMTLLDILLKHENFQNSPSITIKIRRLLNKISDDQMTSKSEKRENLSFRGSMVE